MVTTIFNSCIVIVITSKLHPTGKMWLSRHRYSCQTTATADREEPCEVKISRTVLKTSRRGDSAAEFNLCKYVTL